MRYEMTGVAGDRRRVFPHADPRRLVANDPGSDQGVTVAEAWKRRVRLVDPPFFAVGPAFAKHLGASVDGDVGAFARVQRLLHVIPGDPEPLERSRKQV